VIEGYRPTWVDVDLSAIRENARILKPETAELMAVVKANGYGHERQSTQAPRGPRSRWSRKG
jgi:alanine racemase